MAPNFLETLRNYFTTEFSNQAANSLDESGAAVSQALSAIVPVALSGIMAKATSGNEGADSVFNMARDATAYLSPIPNLTDLHNDERGSEIPSRIFEGSQSDVEKSIARFAGIRNSSASYLITLALPAVMGFLGKYAAQNNLSAVGLAGFLSSQKDSIVQGLPSGISSLAPVTGFGASQPLASTTSAATSAAFPINNPDTTGKGKKWLIPLIIIIAVILLLLYFSRGCNNTTTNNTVVADTSAA